MRDSLVTLDEAVAAVVAQHGGVRAAERATGVDKSFISRLMRGQKVAPSAETLEALGLRAVPLYEVLKTPNDGAKPPKLTIAVRRGLRTIALLAGGDIDADQSNECPNYKGRALRDINSALRWIDCLDEQTPPPKVNQAAARAAVEASKAADALKPANVGIEPPKVGSNDGLGPT